MSEENNRGYFPLLQAVLIVGALILGALMFCVYGLDIKITTTPPKAAPAPAPTATPSPLYVILTEQAKASARVQVITAETDNEIRLRWNIHFMRRWWALWLIPVLGIVATSAWLIAYKKGGQDD